MSVQNFPGNMRAQMGEMIVAFSLLESVVRVVASSLVVEPGNVGRIASAEIPFRNLRSLALNLYRDRHGEDEDFTTLRALMQRAASLESKMAQLRQPPRFGDLPSTEDDEARQGAIGRTRLTRARHMRLVAGELSRLSHEIRAHWHSMLASGKATNQLLPYLGKPRYSGGLN